MFSLLIHQRSGRSRNKKTHAGRCWNRGEGKSDKSPLYLLCRVKGKTLVKADIALPVENPTSELRDVTCHMGSHSVTCLPTKVNAPPPNPSHAGWYSIYLPRRNGRLSWPSWLDSAPAGVELATFRSRVWHPTTAQPRLVSFPSSITTAQQTCCQVVADLLATCQDTCSLLCR